MKIHGFHSKHFKDPVTGACTNLIENKWGVLKRKIPRNCRRKERLRPYLFEQVWRNIHKDNLWDAFLGALKNVKYPEEVPPDDGEFEEIDGVEDDIAIAGKNKN